MAISFAQAQAALDSGFLENLGQQRDDVGVSLSKTDAAIIKAAAKFVQDARDNLQRSNRIASGALEKSIVPRLKQFGNGVTVIEIFVNYYYKFVDAGVAGWQSGQSRKGYKFKKTFPSQNMIDSIERYLINEGKAFANTKVAVTPREMKRAKQIPASRKAAIGKSVLIKRYGLPASNFWSDAINELEKDIATGIANALKIDVIEKTKM
jgi:hypothetical protein